MTSPLAIPTTRLGAYSNFIAHERPHGICHLISWYGQGYDMAGLWLDPPPCSRTCRLLGNVAAHDTYALNLRETGAAIFGATWLLRGQRPRGRPWLTDTRGVHEHTCCVDSCECIVACSIKTPPLARYILFITLMFVLGFFVRPQHPLVLIPLVAWVLPPAPDDVFVGSPLVQVRTSYRSSSYP
jgi:hypothetical protein